MDAKQGREPSRSDGQKAVGSHPPVEGHPLQVRDAGGAHLDPAGAEQHAQGGRVPHGLHAMGANATTPELDCRLL
jgi:hypothetical protein